MKVSMKDYRLAVECLKQIDTARDFLSGAGNGKPMEVHISEEYYPVPLIDYEKSQQGQLTMEWHPMFGAGLPKIVVKWRLPKAVIHIIITQMSYSPVQ